jgi:hypothetical protein
MVDGFTKFIVLIVATSQTRSRDCFSHQSDDADTVLQVQVLSPYYHLVAVMDSGRPPFWYPNLSDTEIIEALNQWNLTVTPKMLAKPTEDFVLTVFSRCIDQVLGITVDVLEDSMQSAISSIRSDHAVSYCRLARAHCR